MGKTTKVPAYAHILSQSDKVYWNVQSKVLGQLEASQS